MVDTPQTWAARNAARLAIYLLLAIVLVVTFLQVRKWREDAKTGAARIEQRDQTAAAAGGIADDFTRETDDRRRVEIVVSSQNAQLARDLEALRNENPSLDHWMRGDIPGELRQLARERREARDRLRGAEAGRQGIDPGEGAPRANPAR